MVALYIKRLDVLHHFHASYQRSDVDTQDSVEQSDVDTQDTVEQGDGCSLIFFRNLGIG
jgi:hypothetical protein